MRSSSHMIIFIISLSVLLFFENVKAGIPYSYLFDKAIPFLFDQMSKMNYCSYRDCCYLNEIKSVEEIQSILFQKTFGQHIAVETISKRLHAHLKMKQPNKALVMSLHGSFGTGKTHLINQISQIIYKQGMKNSNVHLFNSFGKFTDKSKFKQIQDQWSTWIQSNVSLCERSMFIFDDVDNLPPGFIGFLKPFVDSWDYGVGKVAYRKSIFFFLSNTLIIEKYFVKQYQNGHKREEFTLSELNKLLLESAFTGTGGFIKSALIEHRLISDFIPFLPLELKHIVECIRAYLKENYNKSSDVDIENDVILELEMGPSENFPLYSVYGCRPIPDLVIKFNK